MNNWLDELPVALEQRREQSLYRQRESLVSPESAVLCHGTETWLNFSSNDYLGLASHPGIVAAFKAAADEYGVGAGSAHLVVGHRPLHHELERALAEHTGRERALLFSSGYMANIGVLGALLSRGDAVFEDRLNHASLLDGGLASGAAFHRFRHNDAGQLRELLLNKTARRKLVAVDAVFSMDGDIAPLVDLSTLCADSGAVLMVDDAHGFGVLGTNGAGTLEQLGLSQQQVPILMGTLGKACGVTGAFVAGSEALIETLIQQARTYIYTTALPPACAAAASAALRLVRDEPQRRQHLQALVACFRERIGAVIAPYGEQVSLAQSATPIQPLLVGEARTALQLSQALRSRGIHACAIRPPTVPQGSARLRFSLSAAHAVEHIAQLADALAAALDACMVQQS